MWILLNVLKRFYEMVYKYDDGLMFFLWENAGMTLGTQIDEWVLQNNSFLHIE